MRLVANDLLRLDLWALSTLSKIDRWGTKYGEIEFREFWYLHDLVNKDERSRFFSKSAPSFEYNGLRYQDEEIHQYLNEFSEDRLIRRIQDLQTIPLLGNLFNYCLTVCNVDKSHQARAEASLPSIPDLWEEDDDDDDETKRLKQEDREQKSLPNLVINTRESQSVLRTVHKLSLQLQSHISVAASELDETSLVTLKEKMEVLQEGFDEVCKVLQVDSSRLVYLDRDPWW
jgi:hypothetical protein